MTLFNVSRRGFLKGVASSGALVLAVRLVPQALWADPPGSATNAESSVLHPSAFLGIDTDGTVYIVAHRSEMGTGIRTSLPLVVADELDADWTRVKIEQATGDPRYGNQDTDGSWSIRGFYDVMREAGATGRMMLMQAAAQQWKVPVSECETELHNVVHRASGRKAGYGELASAAAKLPVPKKEDLRLKSKESFRYIGKGMPSFDLTNMCTGRATYGADIRVDGMLYASIERPPVLGGKIKTLEDKQALQVKGVRQTVPIDPFTPPHGFQALGGVAVIADNTWSAMQGRKKLKIEWDNGSNAAYNSTSFKKELEETASKPGKAARTVGDVDAEFAKGGKVMEASYYVPLLAHASMEPPVAVADSRNGKVTVWCSTQDPQGLQESVGKALGIPKESVLCHVPLLGGGFGRKSMHDVAVEAAILSKKVGSPVKVAWSREDDIKFDYYHAVSAMYMKAALDSRGRPTAWLQRSVFTPIGSTFDVHAQYGGNFELCMGWTDMPFDIPNLRVENGPATAHVRIGWLRSVANIYHAFAVQSFANELAYAANREPLEYLLELIGPARSVDLKGVDYPNYNASLDTYPVDTGRLRRVTEMAAEKAVWGKRKMSKGTGMGIAAHRSFLTYVATVVEVEVSDQGDIRIPRVETVVDLGTVVNPEITRAQFESAAVFGTSLALMGEITAKNGAIEQSNFNDYPVARMYEAPYQTNVSIVESSAPPAGVGEPGVPPFAPALCNAIFAATGKRIRDLPIAKTSLAT
ncbi:MAG: molybdopterin cofactor-binding domain-containing protein [Terriglobales bacterium]